MEEAVLLNGKQHNTTCICTSLTADVFQLEKDLFIKMVSHSNTSWQSLIDQSIRNYKAYDQSMRNHQRQNFKIIDKLQTDFTAALENV